MNKKEARLLGAKQNGTLRYVRSELQCPGCGEFHRGTDEMVECLTKAAEESGEVNGIALSEWITNIHYTKDTLADLMADVVFQENHAILPEEFPVATRLVCTACLPQLEFTKSPELLKQQAAEAVQDSVNHMFDIARIGSSVHKVRRAYQLFSLALPFLLLAISEVVGAPLLLVVGPVFWVLAQTVHRSNQYASSSSSIHPAERILWTGAVFIACQTLYIVTQVWL